MTLSQEAEKVLQEILDNVENDNYWHDRFEKLTRREDSILRGCFKELSDSSMIAVTWASNVPYFINILKDGYLYEENNRGVKSIKLDREELGYDVFLSHANKDKLEFVNDLNKSLEKLGVKIFYDSESIEWGDNWKQRILEGVEKATFAIIVISENFFDRAWTEKELNEFLTRQTSEGQKLILPIIHNISNDDLRERYPEVGDIQTISSQEHTADEIALQFAKQLIKRLRNNY
ncbi:TPA: toll/interleukin-1 receptor domain-containing protein [Streptococcus suis]|nr:toll/interleukin-1 receptor domain-containing protein [Streptococcus suis]HEM3568134.1 toll/interleukin-1 receptor domain-containing protein [Streptococcus suis]HEM4764034.1 toll/interleukin-1 receptor domain-containing protein [Streptococcus suis]HEM4886737.1 toll/interleukin-1 receptor domain-containing protein [Streptococcus suis]